MNEALTAKCGIELRVEKYMSSKYCVIHTQSALYYFHISSLKFFLPLFRDSVKAALARALISSTFPPVDVVPFPFFPRNAVVASITTGATQPHEHTPCRALESPTPSVPYLSFSRSLKTTLCHCCCFCHRCRSDGLFPYVIVLAPAEL